MYYVAFYHQTEDRLEHGVTDFRLAEFLATYPFARVISWLPLTGRDESDFATFNTQVERMMRP